MKKIGVAVLILLLTGLSALFIVRAMVEDKILETHTRYLFSQIEGELPTSVRIVLSSSDDHGNWHELMPQQYRILADALRKATQLDWNSCSLNGDTLLDGWNRKCIVESRKSPTPSIRLISYGRDGTKGTDDIVREIEIKSETIAEPTFSGDVATRAAPEK